MKTMKTYVVKIAKEEFGHMVLLAVFDVVDDTKFVHKVVLDVRIYDTISALSYHQRIEILNG